MLDACLSAFGSMSRALEALYVIRGLKPVARLAVPEQGIGAVQAFCKGQGLALETADFKVAMQFEGAYSTKGFLVDRDSAMQGHLFIYLSKWEELAKKAKVAEQMQAYNVFGQLLGYPECCRKFFVKHKPLQETLGNDYLIPALQASSGRRFAFPMNVFGRYFDAVLLSHAPCSLDCEASLKIARENYELLCKEAPGVAAQLKNVLSSTVVLGDEIILLLGWEEQPALQKEGFREISFSHALATKPSALANMLAKAKRITVAGEDRFLVGDSDYSMPLLFFR